MMRSVLHFRNNLSAIVAWRTWKEKLNYSKVSPKIFTCKGEHSLKRKISIEMIMQWTFKSKSNRIHIYEREDIQMLKKVDNVGEKSHTVKITLFKLFGYFKIYQVLLNSLIEIWCHFKRWKYLKFHEQILKLYISLIFDF